MLCKSQYIQTISEMRTSNHTLSFVRNFVKTGKYYWMVQSRCTFGTWLIELDCLFPCEKLDDPLDEKLIVATNLPSENQPTYQPATRKSKSLRCPSGGAYWCGAWPLPRDRVYSYSCLLYAKPRNATRWARGNLSPPQDRFCCYGWLLSSECPPDKKKSRRHYLF